MLLVCFQSSTMDQYHKLSSDDNWQTLSTTSASSLTSGDQQDTSLEHRDANVNYVDSQQNAAVSERSRHNIDALSGSMRQQLFEMLQRAMSETNYRQLVDGGHVPPSLERADQVDRDDDDVRQPSSSITVETPRDQVMMSSEQRRPAAVYACHLCDFIVCE